MKSFQESEAINWCFNCWNIILSWLSCRDGQALGNYEVHQRLRYRIFQFWNRYAWDVLGRFLEGTKIYHSH